MIEGTIKITIFAVAFEDQQMFCLHHILI